MCPVCLTTAMIVAASVTSTGGIAATALKKLGAKPAGSNHPNKDQSKENHHG